jgi:L-lactate dehydrogenase complex protein LldE
MTPLVQLFITCLGENFYSHMLQDMVAILERLGVECRMPEHQTCCGQPFFNSGLLQSSLPAARQWLHVFGRTDGYIVAPSASCVGFVRQYYPVLFPEGTPEHYLAQEAASRTYEFTEFLTKVLRVTDVGAWFPHRVTYHASCHLLRELGLRNEPKQLLQNVAGLEMIPLQGEETCCGFGGIFSVVYPEVSSMMMKNKVRAICQSGAEVLVVAEIGCLMNIQGGLHKAHAPVQAMHLIQVLAQENPDLSQRRSAQ